MKPLKIEMNYFGPYEHGVVDFERFNESPLFLISGPTGAGKTTIFDAMTFALFGEGSGSRKPEAMRSDFATLNDETFVRFWFEHNGKFYLAERHPAQTRAKKRGAGEVQQKATATVSAIDYETGVEQGEGFSKIPEVNAFIEDLLALSADQFRQIILLPQQEFQKFLAAKSDKKEAILRNLFGTELFREFMERIKDQQRQFASEQAKFETQLENIFANVTWTGANIEQYPLTRTLAERIALLATEVEQQAILLTSNQAANTQAQAKYQAVSAAYEAALSLSKDFEQLASAQLQAQQLAAQQADADEQAQTLKHYQWAQQQATLVNELAKVSQDLPVQVKALNDVTEQLTVVTKQQGAAELEQAELAHQAPQNEAQKQSALEIQNKLLPLVEQQANAKQQLTKYTAEVNENKQTLDDVATQLTENAEQITSKQAQLAKYAELEVQQTNFAQQQLAWQVISQQATDVQRQAQLVTDAQTDLTTAQKRQATLTVELSGLQVDLDEQRRKRQTLMIQQLQNELVAGEACVVCGATEHPLHSQSHHEVSDADIRQAIDDLEQQQSDFNKLEATLSESTIQVGEKTAKLTVARATQDELQASLTTEYAQFSTEFNALFDAVQMPTEFDRETGTQILTELSAMLKQQKQAATALTTALADLAHTQQTLSAQQNELKNKLAVAQVQVDTAEKALGKINEQTPTLLSAPEYRTQLNELNATVTAYEQAVAVNQKHHQALAVETATLVAQQASGKNNVAKLQAQELNAQQKLATALAEGGFDEPTLMQWLAELNDHDVLRELGDAVASYQAKVNQANATIAALQTKLAAQTEPDLAGLKTQRVEADTARETSSKQVIQQEGVVQQLHTAQTQISAVQAKQGAQAQRAEELAMLADAVNGKNNFNLPLERYVLQSYLTEVLEYANRNYFGNLSNGRYQFEIKKDKASRANQTGLEINIYDNDTNDSRPSDTLSGGEKFLAALSIALSLAAVIQDKSGGVQIDALFIDEGFGSLDGQTLEKAMEALDQIEKEGRMIGVISHVDSMKSRIGQQLQIHKKGNAQSEISYQLV